MLALLITLLIFAAIVGLARMQLSDSLFRDNFFLPWGEMVDLPPQAEKVWANSIRKPGGLPPEARQAPTHYLALLVNRDRLARPLLATLIDMAMRGLLQISFNPRSDEFILKRLPIEDPSSLSKLDRAMLGKLFPNEASELPIEWRNADLLGEARRLLERANKKRLGNGRLKVPSTIALGLVGALLLLVVLTVSGTQAGGGGYFVGISAMIWPTFLIWTAGLALKSQRANKATGIARYQERFYLMATLFMGISLMALVNLFALSLALGFIGGLSIMLAGFSIPLLRGWMRQSEKPGKGHKIAVAWLQHFRKNERQETDIEAAKARLAWGDLSAAIAVGGEASWMAAAQLHVDLDSESDLADQDQSSILGEGAPDPDNPRIVMPDGLSFEQETMPLLALHHHITDGLWIDLWQALVIDYTFRLRDELPIGKKAAPAESKAPEQA